MPTHRKRGKSKAKGWVEYKKRSGKRYPRRRFWRKEDGEWVKRFGGSLKEVAIISEQEYKDYVKSRRQSRKARKNAHRQRSN